MKMNTCISWRRVVQSQREGWITGLGYGRTFDRPARINTHAAVNLAPRIMAGMGLVSKQRFTVWLALGYLSI